MTHSLTATRPAFSPPRLTEEASLVAVTLISGGGHSYHGGGHKGGGHGHGDGGHGHGDGGHGHGGGGEGHGDSNKGGKGGHRD